MKLHRSACPKVPDIYATGSNATSCIEGFEYLPAKTYNSYRAALLATAPNSERARILSESPLQPPLPTVQNQEYASQLTPLLTFKLHSSPDVLLSIWHSAHSCRFAIPADSSYSVLVAMGFKLKNLGKHLAGGVLTFAHGVADHLGNSIVAPPAPILVGTAAVFAGAAVVKHFQKRNRKAQRSPTTDEVLLRCHICSFSYMFCILLVVLMYAVVVVCAEPLGYCRMTAAPHLHPALCLPHGQRSLAPGHPHHPAQSPSSHRSPHSDCEVLDHSLDRQLPTVR